MLNTEQAGQQAEASSAKRFTRKKLADTKQRLLETRLNQANEAASGSVKREALYAKKAC
jgi:hypothetical protein